MREGSCGMRLKNGVRARGGDRGERGGGDSPAAGHVQVAFGFEKRREFIADVRAGGGGGGGGGGGEEAASG